MRSKHKVVILQHRLLHYRTEFFERLRQECLSRGIRVDLVHGQPSSQESYKRDTGTLAWARSVRNRFWRIAGKDLVWQPFPAAVRDSDLVVVMQENRLISNYPLLFSRLVSRRKVAYWGHGKNFQSNVPGGLRERWKTFLLSKVDWWFAYTQQTVGILKASQYPSDRITCLNNAIDTGSFQRDLASISGEELADLRSKLGISSNGRVGIFCGSLWPEKRLGYLVSAVDKIRDALPDFHMVVVGDGPSASEIQFAAKSRPWLSWVGVRKGREKAAYFQLADVVLNPGAVGLHVLDSFCAEAPLVTTPDARHGPEIAYLKNEENGLIVGGTPDAYADAVISLLRDEARLQAIKQAALRDAGQYSLDNMVARFSEGIEQCLSMPKKSLFGND